MIVALLAVGGLAAAAGTRGAAAAFVAAAGLAALGEGAPALGAWIAITAAVLVLTDRAPRRIALPALGAAAVIAAGSTRNVAAVFGLWVLGTVAAVVSRGEGAASDRWAITLVLSDLPVLAAVAWTGFEAGFEAWPGAIGDVVAVLLLVATFVRAPLASGPGDDASGPGLLVVRAQTLLLPLVAIGSLDPDSGLVPIWLVVGAAAMAVAGLLGREATRDAVQEAGLLVIVVAAANAGSGAQGWEWGVLAGGTLMHSLRLRVESQVTGPLAAALLRSGGIGLPLLPAAVVALEGGMRHGGWAGAAVSIGSISGLAARAARSTARDAGPAAADPTEPKWSAVVTWTIVGAAVVGALWAPLFTFPRRSAAASIEWPPLWAGVAVVAAAVSAAVLGARVPASAGDGQRRATLTLGELRAPAGLGRPRMVVMGAAVLAGGAVAVWFAGALRGFL